MEYLLSKIREACYRDGGRLFKKKDARGINESVGAIWRCSQQ